MINTLFGIKKNMTSIYDYRGRRAGATVIEVTPNVVTQIKSAEGNDGYDSIQVGIGNKKSVRKPQLGHFKKAGVDKSLAFTREIRVKQPKNPNVENTVEGIEAGQEIKVTDVLQAGDLIKVTGVSKGKGFQGGVRRHGFHGGPKTHGQSDRHRAPGSIGSGTTPGRVLKGKKMAGHMGTDTVSVLNLEVVSIDKDSNLLTVKGGIPGPIGGLVRLEKQGVLKGYVAPEEPEEVGESVEQSVSEPEQVSGSENSDEVESQNVEVLEEVAEPVVEAEATESADAETVEAEQPEVENVETAEVKADEEAK